nr:MAG: hypothetical protein AM324_07180 [Candidatus Thorarchaeota archaeon SMTZ1-83]
MTIDNIAIALAYSVQVHYGTSKRFRSNNPVVSRPCSLSSSKNESIVFLRFSLIETRSLPRWPSL